MPDEPTIADDDRSAPAVVVPAGAMLIDQEAQLAAVTHWDGTVEVIRIAYADREQ